MPTTYESKTTTTAYQSTTIRFHQEYVRTIPGILKIVEIVSARAPKRRRRDMTQAKGYEPVERGFNLNVDHR